MRKPNDVKRFFYHVLCNKCRLPTESSALREQIVRAQNIHQLIRQKEKKVASFRESAYDTSDEEDEDDDDESETELAMIALCGSLLIDLNNTTMMQMFMLMQMQNQSFSVSQMLLPCLMLMHDEISKRNKMFDAIMEYLASESNSR